MHSVSLCLGVFVAWVSQWKQDEVISQDFSYPKPQIPTPPRGIPRSSQANCELWDTISPAGPGSPSTDACLAGARLDKSQWKFRSEIPFIHSSSCSRSCWIQSLFWGYWVWSRNSLFLFRKIVVQSFFISTSATYPCLVLMLLLLSPCNSSRIIFKVHPCHSTSVLHPLASCRWRHLA